MTPGKTVLKQVRDLVEGDVCAGSGFLVLNVTDSIHCPRGKLEVTGSYPREDTIRRRYWNAGTTIHVRRKDN